MKLTPINGRDNRNDERPRPNENIGKRSVPGGWSTAEVLVDIEPVTSNNIFWSAKGNRVRFSSWEKANSAYAKSSARREFRL